MRPLLLVAVAISSFTGMQSAVAADVENGKKIYDQMCLYCHQLDYDEKFGPGLAGITERRDDEWLHKFLEYPGEMIKSDEYAQTLKEGNSYDLTMPALPEMKNRAAREDVIEYMRTLE